MALLSRVTPEALMVWWNLALPNRDIITIDAVKNTINLKISDEEFGSKTRQLGTNPNWHQKKEHT
jgi:dihydroxy-acid dehydratase